MATGHSRLQSLTGTRPILKDRFSKARESLLKGVRFVRALCWKSISLIRAFMSWFNANWKGKGDRRYIVNRYSAFSPFAKINTTTTANKRHDSTDKRNCYCVRERIVCFSRIGKKKKISLISIDKYELAWFFKIDGEKYIYIYFYLFRVIMDVGRFFFFLLSIREKFDTLQ